jgi:hypothetical protein
METAVLSVYVNTSGPVGRSRGGSVGPPPTPSFRVERSREGVGVGEGLSGWHGFITGPIKQGP